MRKVTSCASSSQLIMHLKTNQKILFQGDLNTEVSGERFTVGGKGTELSIALTRKGDYTTYTCR